TTSANRPETVSCSEAPARTTSPVPSPVKSPTAMPGQTRLPLGARHFRLRLSPRSATTSYEPQITAGWPSPSRSATAGEEYQPLWQYGPDRQPPYCHSRTGALMPAVEKLAVTVVSPVRVRVQLPVPEHPPSFQPAKVDPSA